MKKLLLGVLYALYIIAIFIGTIFLIIYTVGSNKFANCSINCNAGKFSIVGTYYLQKGNGELDNSTYIIIENGEIGDKLNEGDWRDSDGLRGKYEYSSGNITFYDGSKTYPILSGTIKDDKLVIKTGEYSQTTYVKR